MRKLFRRMVGRYFPAMLCLCAMALPAPSAVGQESDFSGDYAMDRDGPADERIALRVSPYREGDRPELDARLTKKQRRQLEWIGEAFDSEQRTDEGRRTRFEQPEDGFYDADPDFALARQQHGLTCTVSTFLMLCRVDPGTTFSQSRFVARTGYFVIMMHHGPINLVKRPSSKNGQ